MPSSFFNFISNFDSYSESIGLRYESQAKYSTTCGICTSLSKNILIFLFALSLLAQAVLRTSPDISYFQFFRSDEADLNRFNALANDIEIAYDVYYRNPSGEYVSATVDGIDESFFNITAVALNYSVFGEVQTVTAPSYKCIDFERITGRRPFAQLSQEEFNSKLENATCVDTSDVYFQGSILNGENFLLEIGACVNTTDGGNGEQEVYCHAPELINQYANQMMFMTYASHNNFDVQNYENPVNQKISLISAIQLDSSRRKGANVELKQTLLSLQDNILNVGQSVEWQFMSASLKRGVLENSVVYRNQRRMLAQVNFYLVDESFVYTRKTFDLMQVLISVGGFAYSFRQILACLIICQVPKHSLSYYITSKYMKEKKNKNKQGTSNLQIGGSDQIMPMPNFPIDDVVAARIFDMAGLKSISSAMACCLVHCPFSCCVCGRNKLMKKGHKRFAEATDVANLIRLTNKVKIFESLLFTQKQRALMALHKKNFLRQDSSTDDSSDKESLFTKIKSESSKTQVTKLLRGQRLSSQLDKQLYYSAICGGSKALKNLASGNDSTTPHERPTSSNLDVQQSMRMNSMSNNGDDEQSRRTEILPFATQSNMMQANEDKSESATQMVMIDQQQQNKDLSQAHANQVAPQ